MAPGYVQHSVTSHTMRGLHTGAGVHKTGRQLLKLSLALAFCTTRTREIVVRDLG
jgi:hypothetical protein